MKIAEITKTENIADTISILKNGKDIGEKLSKYKKQYNVLEHDTFDKVKRPNKIISVKDENDHNKTISQKTQEVNRVAFPLQKRIVDAAVQFAFGNPVKLNCEPKDKQEESVLDALKRILYDNKIESFNQKVATDLFRSTEVAEIWFADERESHSSYGFDTKFKVKAVCVSPWLSSLLYPTFDSNGNMIAFSREYIIVEDKKEVKYFDIYTETEIKSYKQTETDWIELKNAKNPINKIPIAFATQEETEWHDIQNAIDRLELLLSNFAETNDYFAAPKIFIQGQIVDMPSKGEGGQVIQGELGSSAEIISWNHATDAVKLEIETLLGFIYKLTQTPDFSFENVKGLGAVSGTALKMLFMDAHLKVKKKRQILDEYLQRRINVILAFIGTINTSLKKATQTIQITPEIVPYMIDDLDSLINTLYTANGGKAIISQKTTMEKSGLVVDTELEWKQLQDEATAENQTAIGSTVV
jgi:SPP1 family phage portal protein